MDRRPEFLLPELRGLQLLVERILMQDEPFYPGLEGVIAGETAISMVEGGLLYRGYRIEDLAARSTFPEVALLLLSGELPGQEALADFQSILAESMELPDPIVHLMAEIPLHVGAMDVLRTGISALAHFDPQPDDTGPEADLSRATRLLAQIPLLIATRQAQLRGEHRARPVPELSFAGNLLAMLTGEQPDEEAERALDLSLILYAEHEFNASAFTARVVTSTGSDLHSAITAATGALKGPLHGGANEAALDSLLSVGGSANAEDWVRTRLATGERIMGFGHRVYKLGDPRAEILEETCAALAHTPEQDDLQQTATIIARLMRQEKGLFPNLDWPCARLYHYLGLEADVFTPLFVASRVAGWSAHVIEQAANNRLIRPRSRYTGPSARKFVPLALRD